MPVYISDHGETTWRTSFKTATAHARYHKENSQLCLTEGKELNQQVAGVIGAFHKQGHEKQDKVCHYRSERFYKDVDNHKGSVLSKLLFIIM